MVDRARSGRVETESHSQIALRASESIADMKTSDLIGRSEDLQLGQNTSDVELQSSCRGVGVADGS